MVQRVEPDEIKSVLRPRRLPPPLPHLVTRQVTRREHVSLAEPPRHLHHVLLAHALGLDALLDVGALAPRARVALVRLRDEPLDLIGRGARAVGLVGAALAAVGSVEVQEGRGGVVAAAGWGSGRALLVWIGATLRAMGFGGNVR